MFEGDLVILNKCCSDLYCQHFQYLGSTETSESYRQMCLEVVVTLAETAPAMMRKESSKYIIQLIGQVLELMATVEEDENWGTQDDPDETDQER